MYHNLLWQKSIFTPPGKEVYCQSLPNALHDIAIQWPNEAAVIADEKVYSFKDLASRVAGLSEEIKALSNHPGPIALVQKMGLDAIAAWFACALSGRPFLLLEPDQPRERLIALMRTSNCVLALVDATTSSLFIGEEGIISFISKGCLGDLQSNTEDLAHQPLMVFPTSGSSGEPKLIAYNTFTIQVKVQSSIQLMQVQRGARVLIAGSYSNYGFLHHALVFLLSGGTICLIDIKRLGFNSILESITKLEVRHIRFTPSLFRKLAVLPKAKKCLKLLDAVRFSGEPLLKEDLKLAKSVLKEDCLIQNIYGSTESALFIWSSVNDNTIDENPTVPIGRIYPLSAFAIQPLDGVTTDCSKGALLIRSKYHAIGDLKDGLLHQERFPLLDKNSDERIYETGDIVQQLPDGSLIHLGRSDRMVKIRGSRVFLTEVEQQLRAISAVTGAAVLDRKEQDNVVIYGFVSTNTNITAIELRNQLSTRIPEFMIPKSIQIIPQIPLMAGGKVDYQALVKQISFPQSIENMEIENADDCGNAYALLTQIWDSILWKDAHKFHSDFFTLGGDSLSFMLLIVLIEEKFGINIRPDTIKNKCTLEQLALVIGLKKPGTTTVVMYKSIQARLFLASTSPSKGIALAMPSLGGVSNVYPFYQAGFFLDHDIWVIDVPLQEGNMLQEDRWWKVAFEIVQGIKEGYIPTSRVFFGFSFAGGLSWLVARLLSNAPQRPEFVVIIDAPPLHRRPKLKQEMVEKALERVSHSKMPAVIHVCRPATIGEMIHQNRKEEWKNKDAILKIIELPTANHMDMINWEVLSLAKEAVESFLHAREHNFDWRSLTSPPNLFGCFIFYALQGDVDSLSKVIAEFETEETKKIPIEDHHVIHLAILSNARKDIKQSETLLKFARKRWPYSTTMHYLNRRLKRNASLLFLDNIPKICPVSIVTVESKLAKFKKQEETPSQIRFVKMLSLTYDILFAFLYARCLKLKSFLTVY